jgi:hypothetical protein
MGDTIWPRFEETGIYETLETPPRYFAVYRFESGGHIRHAAKDNRSEAEKDLQGSLDRNVKFWTDRLNSSRSDARVVIVDGHYYSMGPEPSDEYRSNSSNFLGFGGRAFHIHFKGTNGITVSHNLWYGGKIPAEFRDRFPDNAEFVKGEKWVESHGQNFLV